MLLMVLAKGLLQRPATQSHAGALFYAIVGCILVIDLAIGGWWLVGEYRSRNAPPGSGPAEGGDGFNLRIGRRRKAAGETATD